MKPMSHNSDGLLQKRKLYHTKYPEPFSLCSWKWGPLFYPLDADFKFTLFKTVKHLQIPSTMYSISKSKKISEVNFSLNVWHRPWKQNINWTDESVFTVFIFTYLFPVNIRSTEESVWGSGRCRPTQASHPYGAFMVYI